MVFESRPCPILCVLAILEMTQKISNACILGNNHVGIFWYIELVELYHLTLIIFKLAKTNYV